MSIFGLTYTQELWVCKYGNVVSLSGFVNDLVYYYNCWWRFIGHFNRIQPLKTSTLRPDRHARYCSITLYSNGVFAEDRHITWIVCSPLSTPMLQTFSENCDTSLLKHAFYIFFRDKYKRKPSELARPYFYHVKNKGLIPKILAACRIKLFWHRNLCCVKIL